MHFDERSFVLITLGMESFGRLHENGDELVNQMVVHAVRGVGGGGGVSRGKVR